MRKMSDSAPLYALIILILGFTAVGAIIHLLITAVRAMGAVMIGEIIIGLLTVAFIAWLHAGSRQAESEPQNKVAFDGRLPGDPP